MTTDMLKRLTGALMLAVSLTTLSAQPCAVPAPSITYVDIIDETDATGCGRGGPADEVTILVAYDHVADTNTCGYWFGTKPKNCMTDTTEYYLGAHTFPLLLGNENFEYLSFWHNNIGAQFEFSVERQANANGSYSGCLASTTRVTWFPGDTQAWVVENPGVGSSTGYWVTVYYSN